MGEARATAVVTGASSGIGAATARALAAAQDVAEVTTFAVTRPSHVNLDLIVVKPRDQHSAMSAHRRS